jgi:hypothetical protein
MYAFIYGGEVVEVGYDELEGLYGEEYLSMYGIERPTTGMYGGGPNELNPEEVPF